MAPDPYYDDGAVRLYLGDARALLPGLDADVLITDPPYGLGMRGYEDDFAVGLAGVELSPGRRGAVFHSPRTVIPFLQQVTSWNAERLLWMHKTADIAAPWRSWCMNSEVVVVVSRSAAGWPTRRHYRTDLYQPRPYRKPGGHPNAKPVEVMFDLVLRLSRRSETIIDPFAGSGTTLRCAKRAGRRAVGIEAHEPYAEAAATMLEAM